MQSLKERSKNKSSAHARTSRLRARIFRLISRAASAFAARFPLTPRGVLTALFASLGLIFIALPHNDLVLLVICGTALALLALSLLSSLLSALILLIYTRRIQRKNSLNKDGSSAPRKLECGAELRTEFSLPALRPMPFTHIQWQWIRPEAHVQTYVRGGRLHETVIPIARARTEQIVRRIVITDVFGFTRIRLHARQNQNTRVYPWTGQLRAPSFAHTFAEGGDLPFPEGPAQGDPSDFRRYVAGDPVRFILWKTFAKSRQLVVRTKEQAFSPVHRTVAYLVTGERDEATAAVARAALESGSLGTGWIFGADGTNEIANERAAALDILASSKPEDPETHQNQGGTGLYAFLKKHADQAGTRVVLFVPPVPGPWLERTVSALRRWRKGSKPGGRAHFIGMKMITGAYVLTGLDGFSNPIKWPWYKRVLFMPAPPAQQENQAPQGTSINATHQELGAVVASLSREGAQIAVVDRRTGRISTGAQTRLLFSSIFNEQQPESNTNELKKNSVQLKRGARSAPAKPAPPPAGRNP